jgi:hypothetical protein
MIYFTLFLFVLRISSQNGCQFNMSMNVSFLFFTPDSLSVFLEAGAKVHLIFYLASFL